MYNYITVNTEMPTFMQFPKFLLDMEINETAKLLYMVLLDRARLSMVNKGWQDEYGRVYMVYPIEDLAARLHKCPMTVKTALATLQHAGLIMRKRQGIGRANLIYVKLPEAIQAGYTGNTVETDCRQQTVHVSSDNFPSRATESCPSHGQKNVDLTDNDLSGNKNENIKMIHQKEEINNPRKVYGRYENVSLSDMEYDQLRKEYSHIDEIIDRVSEEMAMYGKTYRNYEAAIRLWISRHRDEYITMSYYARPGESL